MADRDRADRSRTAGATSESTTQRPALKSRAQNLAAIRDIEKRASNYGFFFFESADGEWAEGQESDKDKDDSSLAGRAPCDAASTQGAARIAAAANVLRPKSACYTKARPSAVRADAVGSQEVQCSVQPAAELDNDSWCTFLGPPLRPSSASLSASRPRPSSCRADTRTLRATEPSQEVEPQLSSQPVAQENVSALHDDLTALVSRVALEEQTKASAAYSASPLANKLMRQEEDKKRSSSGHPSEQKRPLSARLVARPQSAISTTNTTPRPKILACSQNDTFRPEASPAGVKAPKRPPLSARGPRRDKPSGSATPSTRGFSAGAPALKGGGARSAREGGLTVKALIHPLKLPH